MNQILITGIGFYGPQCGNTQALLQILRNHQSLIKLHNHFPECNFPGAQIGAVLDEIIIDPNDSAAANITHRRSNGVKATVLAAREAWQQAQLSDNTKSDEIGIILAGENILQYDHYQAQKIFATEPSYVRAHYARQFLDTSVMSILSELFNIRGEGFSVGGSMASGLLAIIQGIRALEAGLSCCLVVAPVAELSPVELQAFHNAQALGGTGFEKNPAAASRPFDKQHNGFIYGQATAAIMLETQEHAQKREASPLATISGYAQYLDAHSDTTPNLQSQINVIQSALQMAGSPIIDYVNAHATSTPLGDHSEAEAIAQTLGDKPLINSTKAVTGHALWAAGLIETVASILQMQNGFCHGNINLDNPITTALNFVGKNCQQAQINHALKLSFGFGGINAALILKKP